MKQFKWMAWSLVLVAALGLVCAGHARAEETQDDDDDQAGWFIPKDSIFKNAYAGIGAGMLTSHFPDSNQDGSVTSVSIDKTDEIGKIYAGYQFTDYLGLEASYVDFEDTEFSGVSDGSGVSWSPGNVSATHEVDGWGLSAVGRIPVTDRFSLLASAGVFWWESTEIFNENGTITREEETGSDGSFGVGFEYDIGKKDRVVLRGEVERRVVDESAYDINTATVGVKYEFP